MIKLSFENTAILLNVLSSIGSLEILDADASKTVSREFKTASECLIATYTLEKLAYCIQDVLEQLSQVSAWGHIDRPTLEIVESAKNKTICAIAKVCLKKQENTSLDSSYKRTCLEKRLKKIATEHFQKSVHLTTNEKRLWNRAIAHVQDLREEDSLQWGLIDRLIDVFFTIQLAQIQFTNPAESKKNR
jgi:hypothetical protein